MQSNFNPIPSFPLQSGHIAEWEDTKGEKFWCEKCEYRGGDKVLCIHNMQFKPSSVANHESPSRRYSLEPRPMAPEDPMMSLLGRPHQRVSGLRLNPLMSLVDVKEVDPVDGTVSYSRQRVPVDRYADVSLITAESDDWWINPPKAWSPPPDVLIGSPPPLPPLLSLPPLMTVGQPSLAPSRTPPPQAPSTPPPQTPQRRRVTISEEVPVHEDDKMDISPQRSPRKRRNSLAVNAADSPLRRSLRFQGEKRVVSCPSPLTLATHAKLEIGEDGDGDFRLSAVSPKKKKPSSPKKSVPRTPLSGKMPVKSPKARPKKRGSLGRKKDARRTLGVENRD